jgi:hypothetical protein
MMIRIVLGILIIAAAIEAGIYITDYYNRSFAAEALNSQIESENQNLTQLKDKTRELNSEIAANNASVSDMLTAIAAENKKIPDQTISPNEIIRTLLNLGEKYNVSIIPLTTQDWARVTTKDFDYRILRISLKIVGTKDNIVQIIKQLPGLYDTLVIENISLNKFVDVPSLEMTPLPTPAAPELTQITASLTLAFYAR